MIATTLDRLDAPTPRVEISRRLYADNRHDRRPQPRNRGGSVAAVIAVVLAFVRVWRERGRIRRRLAAMSERELQDIGICRSDIACETGKPFWRAFEASAIR
jgi:uncharacterized protein YjiS (DUF1127 family)